MAVLIRAESMIPGSGCTMPKPLIVPRPTQPDQIATAAGAAIRSRGQWWFRGAVPGVACRQFRVWVPMRAIVSPSGAVWRQFAVVSLRVSQWLKVFPRTCPEHIGRQVRGLAT